MRFDRASRDARSARRRVLKSLAAGALLPAAPPLLAQVSSARPPFMQLIPVLKDLTGGAQVREGKVKLEIPHLAENGHLVPLTVSVDSPMRADDHVRTLYLLSEKNPRPVIAKIGMSPETGRAALTTRIRLAGAQWVVAVAQLSDGSFWGAAVDVIVTETACLDAT